MVEHWFLAILTADGVVYVPVGLVGDVLGAKVRALSSHQDTVNVELNVDSVLEIGRAHV